MTKNSSFAFSIDRENNIITVKREFAAPPDLIWDAYTKPEILDKWWAPKPWKTRTKTMDFREGGKWHYAMVGPKGEEHWSMVNYYAISPKTLFSGKDVFADGGGNQKKDMPESEWTVAFSEKDNGTLVEIRISFPDSKHLEQTIEIGFREGLAMAMVGLDELLESDSL